MDIKEVIIGQFPVWYEATIGSGMVLGLIATVHLLASHVSVGAALVSTWLATVAVRQNRPELLEYIRQYGIFLLVFSYVLGSITGPGIWFSATVASPRGLSFLIHTNVFLWATEWVFFVIEVLIIYLMVYLAGRIDNRSYLKIAWIFGGASWATMLVIVGILSFMLWPGQESWFTEGGTLRGFFGAYTFAQILSRTCFMLMAAALAGGLIAVRIEDVAFKVEMIKTLSKLGIPAAILGSVFFQYGLTTIPESAALLLKTRLPGSFVPSLWATLFITVAYFSALLIRPNLLKTPVAVVMLVALLVLGIYPEERAREMMRKPYLAAQSVYSNGLFARPIPWLDIESDLPKLEEHGALATLPFPPERLQDVTSGNEVEAGQVLVVTYCSSCHGLSDAGPRPFSSMFGGSTNVAEIEAFIKGTIVTGNMINMPRIPFSDAEVHAVALFIAAGPLWQQLNP